MPKEEIKNKVIEILEQEVFNVMKTRGDEYKRYGWRFKEKVARKILSLFQEEMKWELEQSTIRLHSWCIEENRQRKEKLVKRLEKIKDIKITEKELQDLPSLKGIRYASFAECKRRAIKIIKGEI